VSADQARCLSRHGSELPHPSSQAASVGRGGLRARRSRSHIDALCHVAFDGALYNAKPTASLTPEGATPDAIGVLKDGLIGRGVLLDYLQFEDLVATCEREPHWEFLFVAAPLRYRVAAEPDRDPLIAELTRTG
jgi:hypothetical protein